MPENGSSRADLARPFDRCPFERRPGEGCEDKSSGSTSQPDSIGVRLAIQLRQDYPDARGAPSDPVDQSVPATELDHRANHDDV